MTRIKAVRRGFTLIELLVVLAIIAVLMGLLLSAVQKVRAAANRLKCQNNLKQIGLALHGYHDANRGFPIGAQNKSFPWGGPRLTWFPYLLPYVEQANLFNSFDFTRTDANGVPWANTTNSLGPNPPTAQVVRLFHCPSDSGKDTVSVPYGTYMLGNYLGFFGDLNYGGAWSEASPTNTRHFFAWNRRTKIAHIRDGTSTTMAVGEYLRGRSEGPNGLRDFRGGLWSDQPGHSQLFTQYTPNSPSPDVLLASHCNDLPVLNLPCANSNGGLNDTAASRSQHTGGVHILLCDGSVQFKRDSISLVAWRALGTIAGGEAVGDDQ